MALKVKKTLKILLIGLLWTFLYVCAVVPLYIKIYDFNLLSFSDWYGKWRDFWEYRWEINTGSDVLLSLMMLFFFPLWIYGWYLAVRLASKIKLTYFRRKKFEKNIGEYSANTKKTFTPKKMRVQSAHLLTISLEEAKNNKMAKTSSPSSSAPQKRNNFDADIAALSQIAKSYEVDTFSNLVFEGVQLPLAVSTDDIALLCWIINDKESNWVVDLTEEVAKSDWYSEERHLISPSIDLEKVSKILKEKEESSTIHCAIILTQGNLLNAGETISYYQGKGYSILRTVDASPEEIPTFESYLEKIFKKKGAADEPEASPFEDQSTGTEEVMSDDITEEAFENELAEEIIPPEEPVPEELPLEDSDENNPTLTKE
ncbi:MAG: hypothetical protein LBU87_07135 [Lactobacillales bacterium]|nr:hypothetical protein [Lactobacillales bacterium]